MLLLSVSDVPSDRMILVNSTAVLSRTLLTIIILRDWRLLSRSVGVLTAGSTTTETMWPLFTAKLAR